MAWRVNLLERMPVDGASGEAGVRGKLGMGEAPSLIR